jgi:N-formylglutamate amidohydrolase
MDDPIVAEIRRIREEHAARFNYDLHAMCEDIRRSQNERGLPVVTLPPQRISPLAEPDRDSDAA